MNFPIASRKLSSGQVRQNIKIRYGKLPDVFFKTSYKNLLYFPDV